MCELSPEQLKYLEAGLEMVDHLNLTAARIDYRANKGRNWKKWHERGVSSLSLRAELGLKFHRYVPSCCAPDQTDPAGAIAAYAIVVYGINAFAVDEAITDRRNRTPPKKAKNRAEADERLRESERQRADELVQFYANATRSQT